jgi:RNA polymerase sigma factor (sigma-70 family)
MAIMTEITAKNSLKVSAGTASISGEGVNMTFDQILDTYEKPMYNYFLRLTQDQVLTEDLVQELFVRVYDNLPKFRATASVSTWIYRIAYNLFCDHARRNRRTALYDEVPDTVVPESQRNTGMPEPELVREELQQKVVAALGKLKDDERQIVVLKHYQGMDCKQIAEVMHVAEGTVWSKMHYAFKKLEKYLEGAAENR